MEQIQKILTSIWDEWIVEELLGEGTFGKVYKIKREYLGREQYAALKIIRISQNKTLNGFAFSLDDKSFVDEIVSEIELMSKFKGNSNIVSYEDHRVVEDPDGMGCSILIRMELLTPLGVFLETNEVTAERAIKIGVDLCRALEVLSKHSIIHRDIKLENIFVSENGDFKLGDFGTARIIEKTEDNRTKTGTYMYMAPEVLKSEPYGAKADIYSLGILLYYLLNHQRFPFFPLYPAPITFEDRKISFNKRISGQAIASPDSADPKLSAIILKACEYDSKKRFSSAHEMCLALESLIPKEETIVPEAKKKSNKKGIIIAVAALLTVAITVAAVGIFANYAKSDKTTEINETVNDALQYEIRSDGAYIIGLSYAIDSVEIPEKIEGKPVVSIEDNAFANQPFKTLQLPDSLKEIGDCAFVNCTGLESVILPEGLKTVGMRAFEGCLSLLSVKLPESLESIGDMAFKNCSVLVDINVPSGVVNAGVDIFAYTPFRKNRIGMSASYERSLSLHSEGKYNLCDINGDGIEELLVCGDKSSGFNIDNSRVLSIYDYENISDYVSPEATKESANSLALDISVSTPIYTVTDFGDSVNKDFDRIYFSETESCIYGCIYNDGYEEIYRITIQDGEISETVYQESKFVGSTPTVMGEEIFFDTSVDNTAFLNEVVMRGIIDPETTEPTTEE